MARELSKNIGFRQGVLGYTSRMQNLWTFLGATAISTSAATAVAWFLFKSWAGARIKGEVETYYAKQIETYRSELKATTDKELESFREKLTQDRALQNIATSAFAAAHSASGERRLHAVEEVWDATVKQRNAANRMMLLLDIHTREEIGKALLNPRREESIGAPTDKGMIQDFAPIGEKVERLRPFLDEPLWAIFFGYRALLGRILVMLQQGREKGQLQFWLDEHHTHAMLASLLDPLELKHIEGMPVGGIAQAEQMIEWKLVDAARKTVTGEAASDAALERARLILLRVQEAAARSGVSTPGARP